jgi:hypothetical protein
MVKEGSGRVFTILEQRGISTDSPERRTCSRAQKVRCFTRRIGGRRIGDPPRSERVLLCSAPHHLKHSGVVFPRQRRSFGEAY